MLADTIYQHLKDLYNAKVSSLVESTVVVDPSSTVSQVLGKLSKNDDYDAFCLDGKKVLTTNIRALLVGKDITDMKISPFLYAIPHLKPSDKIQKAANIMSHYRIRSAPVVDKEKIVGAVTQENF